MLKNRFGCLYLPLAITCLACASAVFLLPDCSSTSKTAQFARNLSQERLGLLFQQMARLTEEHVVDWEGLQFRGDKIPAEFQDLSCFRILLHDDSAAITLKHCVDHTQDLVFEGLTKHQIENGEKPAIVLYSNEFDIEKEVLWPEE